MGRHEDLDDDGTVDAQPAVAASDEHAAAALALTGYVYTDPAADPSWTRIAPVESDAAAPDVFPENWGTQLTERDQAAVDAGNT